MIRKVESDIKMLKMSQKQQATTTSDPTSATGATIGSDQLSELFDTIN